MVASKDINGNKYWFEGLPFDGLNKPSPNDMGANKFWFEGLPGETLLSVTAPVNITRAVGHSAAGGTSIATAAFVATAGNFIVVGLSKQQVNVATVTDTAGNTYTRAGSSQAAGVNYLDVYYAYNISGHATNVVTATWSGSGNYRTIEALQFTSMFTASDPLIDNDGASGTSNNIATPTLTSDASGTLFYGIIEHDSPSPVGTNGFAHSKIDSSAYLTGLYKWINVDTAITATTVSSSSYGIKGASFKAYASIGGGSLIKTFFGLANASTKTIDGIANASLKTWSGLSNI